MDKLQQKLTKEEIAFYKKLNTPEKIQDYLDTLKYNHCILKYTLKSPRYVLQEKNAHCAEGALLAALARRVNGYEPLILSIEGLNNDDHLVALFKYKNHWGTMGQSQYETLKWRDPIYKNIRELAMSFFPLYILKEDLSMRKHSGSINMSIFDHLNWMTTKKDLHKLGEYLGEFKHHPIITQNIQLRPVTQKLSKVFKSLKK